MIKVCCFKIFNPQTFQNPPVLSKEVFEYIFTKWAAYKILWISKFLSYSTLYWCTFFRIDGPQTLNFQNYIFTKSVIRRNFPKILRDMSQTFWIIFWSNRNISPLVILYSEEDDCKLLW